MLQGVATLIGAAAVLIAAKWGATTFESWRQQRIAERRMVRAEEILAAAYRARVALGAVRSPLMLGAELLAAEKVMSDDPAFEEQTKTRQERLIRCQAYYARLSIAQPHRQGLYDSEPFARALFGPVLADALERLGHQFWIMKVEADAYVDDTGNDAEYTKKLRMNLFQNTADDNGTVGVATAEAIAAIEAVCLPVLRGDAA